MAIYGPAVQAVAVASVSTVMPEIKGNHGGPLVTVVVPWHILQVSSKVAVGTGSAQPQPYWPCALAHL